MAAADKCRPRPPYNGKNWKVRIKRIKEGKHSNEEIVIESRNQVAAQSALNLILNCINLYWGEPVIPFLGLELSVYRDNDIKNLPLPEKVRFSRRYVAGDIPIPCIIAAKASYKSKYIYAIAKYTFSITNYSLFLVDLDPFTSPHISVSPYPDDQVRFCSAIVSAYSALEELGLEIRASQTNPSMLHGKWNPPVKQDLENRMRKAEINLKETLVWTIRGPKRKIELVKVPTLLSQYHWSNGVMIRDAPIELVDAIAYASWLRSYVSSHRTKDITRVVSPYDVINVQHLARRLILESLGFWLHE